MTEEGVERKLTTILAADVVGYSRLMERAQSGWFGEKTPCRVAVSHKVIARDRFDVSSVF